MNGVEITIERCDVVKENANILVNTANSHLFHDGGLARAFCNHFGDDLIHESQSWIDMFNRVPVGGLAVTSAGSAVTSLGVG